MDLDGKRERKHTSNSRLHSQTETKRGGNNKRLLLCKKNGSQKETKKELRKTICKAKATINISIVKISLVCNKDQM